ncbi:MAG: BTAD domain-containing putative transcriptional regulator [Alphaproteobacteria bacterium]
MVDAAEGPAIRLLGGLEIRGADGGAVRFPTRKTALLVAILALAGPAGMRREAVAELLWPDRGEAQARGSLRQALAAIRQQAAAIPALAVATDGDLIRLAAGRDGVDAARFERNPSADLYLGDLLQGIALDEAVAGWVAPRREALRRKALDLCERLAGEGTGDAGAANLAERLLAADEAAEEAHRALIRIHLRAGRRNAALKQLERCREALRRILDADPEAATLALLAEAPAGAPPTPPRPAPVARAPGPRDRPSVVVLPFENLSGADDEHFVDGVVEEVTSALSRVRDFFVIARQSANAFKGRAVDLREAGRQLGVDYAVEGSVRRAGERVRIAVRLADATRAAQVWSDRYDFDAADVFGVQDRIAAQVAGAIRPALREAEIALTRRRPTADLGAYERVLRALPLLWSQNATANDEAIDLLDAAVAADPSYGRAHALFAWCHSQAVVYLWAKDVAAARRASEQAIERASALVEDDPLGLAAVGAALSQLQTDQEPAAAFIERALRLDPNNAWAWARYGYVALYQGEAGPARERFERALALSPLDPFAFNVELGLGGSAALAGDFAAAARIARRVLAHHPGLTWVYRQLAYYSALAGDLDAARAAVAKLRAAHPHATIEAIGRNPPMRHIEHYWATIAGGLRDAGLPER